MIGKGGERRIVTKLVVMFLLVALVVLLIKNPIVPLLLLTLVQSPKCFFCKTKVLYINPSALANPAPRLVALTIQ
jgi:hypothetical protein